MLFHISGDTLVAYHLNAYLLAFALPVLWYLACLSLRVTPWWALASALAWLSSTANLETLRVGNFAACIVLGALIVARCFRSPAMAWWIAASVLWLAAFVRPEFAVAALGVTGVGAWQLSGVQGKALAARWLAAAMAPAIALSLMFGLPFGGGRSGAAFQQHLAGNILEWHQLPFANWIHYEDVIRRYYALPASAVDFLRHEPLAFLHHVFTNLCRLLTQSLGAALRPPDLMIDASRQLALAPLAITLIGALAVRRGPRPAWAITPTSVVLVACSLLVLVSCAVIYPRAHYLPLLLSAVLLSVAPRAGDTAQRSVLAALVLVGIAGVSAMLPRYVDLRAGLPRPQEETVVALRALGASRPLRLFDDAGIYQPYLRTPARRLGPRDLAPPFDRFLRDNDITVVIVSPQMANDPVLDADPSWHRFRREPQSAGFRCEPLPRTDRTLCLTVESAPER